MLHTWEAERLEHVLSFGRTKPLVVECSKLETAPQDDEGTDDPSTPILERRSMVVKALGLPEVTEYGLFSEVFGNLIAREMGIETPIPCLVNVGLGFVRATQAALSRNNLHLKPGIAAGCDYFSGGYSNVVAQSLSAGEMAQASLIYAFDLLVQNPDRTPVRPNCATRAGHFIVYDFETAFSFLLLIGESHKPWEVSKHGLGPKHLFFNALRHRKVEVTWTPVLNAIRGLSSSRLEEMGKSLPEEWQQRREQVQNHISSVAKHLNKFEIELQRSLL